MCKMKILLKAWRNGGHHQENVKPTNIGQIVKYYLNTYNITNNLSRQNIGFMLK